MGYNLVFNTGILPEASQKHRRHPYYQQMRTNFKDDLSTAHQDLRKKTIDTAQARFGSNVANFTIAEYLQNEFHRNTDE